MGRLSREQDDAFRRMYRAHVPAVYAFFAYSVDAHTAEDLTASTFERALRAFDRFDDTKASERTWLLTIARNALTDHFRRQHHRRGPSTDEHPALLDALVSSEDPLASQVTQETLRDWLGQLNERQQEVVALRFGADLSAREVAESIGISEANVHQITSRALRRLREVADPSFTDSA